MTKVNVKALQTFSHGNVDAKEGGTYAMNKGDAQELAKAGFVAMDGEGEPEQTQVSTPPMKPQPGDVVVDDGNDILGSKMDQTPENKMAPAVDNKRTKAK